MIDTSRSQTTLARTVAVHGFGYWSGLDVSVEFRPAPHDTGVTFVRADMAGQPRIPVCVGNRIDVPLRTVLASGIASVEMVEHILAALAAARIDNCEVWVDRAEMPGMDGSSADFWAAIRSAGRVDQGGVRTRLVVTHPIRVQEGESYVLAEPAHRGEFHVAYDLEYASCPAIGRQVVGFDVTPESFGRELCAARTFLLEREAEWLRSQGMGRRVTFRDLLVFDDQGPIDNRLRYEDECVRHKVLDVIGDLALTGCDLVGRFTAFRSGHKLNAEMVRTLLREAEWCDGGHEQPQRRSA